MGIPRQTTAALALAGLGAVIGACALARPEEEARCAFVSSGARWLAFASRTSGRHDIAVTRADGTCEATISTGGDNLFPSWSPAGKIVFATDRGGGLGMRVHDLATGAERDLGVGDLFASAPAFSPDGGAIAFEGRVAGATTTDIYVLLIDAEGAEPLRLTNDPASDAGPAWSPDGAFVHFVSDRTGVREIFTVPSSGGTAVQVTIGSSILGRPAASPDGRSLAWARPAAAGSSEVVVAELETGSIRIVTSQGDSEPAFEPSGARLAVRTLRYGGNPSVVIVDVTDGGNAARLTRDAEAAGTPAFAP